MSFEKGKGDQVMEDGRRRRKEEDVKRIEMCYVLEPNPQGEYNHCVLLTKIKIIYIILYIN